MSEILKPLFGDASINGHVALPGGLILQWGVNAHTSAGNTTADFPIPFPTACLMAVGNNFANTDTELNGHVRNFTSTAIRTYSASGHNVSWIAIGH